MIESFRAFDSTTLFIITKLQYQAQDRICRSRDAMLVFSFIKKLTF